MNPTYPLESGQNPQTLDASVRQQAYQIVERYCSVGNNPNLYNRTLKQYMDRIPEWGVDDSRGELFFLKNRPPRIEKYRPISEKELGAIHDLMTQEFNRAIAAMEDNSARGVTPHVSHGDFMYVLRQIIGDAFRRVHGDVHRVVKAFQGSADAPHSHTYGGYGTGKRRKI